MLQWHRACDHPSEHQLADGHWVRGIERRTTDGGIVGIRTDVTARVQAERTLLEAKEAAEAAKLEVQAVNAQLEDRVAQRSAELLATQEELLKKERLSAIGQLTATVAHEIRNPLSAIRHTIFTVKELTASQGLPLDRPIARLERSITRCDEIVTDLLDFTRTPDLRLSQLPLDAWLGEVLTEYSAPSEIILERRLNAPGVLVAVDPERFRRVLINLFDNAVQAIQGGTGGDRRIIISTLASPVVELVVRDTGPGISADVLPKIFEPLFTTKSFGTGLGLPTVKQIVDQHGGSISVHSERGRGTSVRIQLRPSSAKNIAA